MATTAVVAGVAAVANAAAVAEALMWLLLLLWLSLSLRMLTMLLPWLLLLPWLVPLPWLLLFTFYKTLSQKIQCFVFVYCLFGVNNFFFLSILIFFALFGMLLKGMGERFLLSEDEPLTPNIDGVMAL